MGLEQDQDEPGQHDQQAERHPAKRPQGTQPARRAVPHGQDDRGESRDHRRDRSLDQDAGADGEPENRCRPPLATAGLRVGEIDPGERPHGGRDGRAEDRVGRREARLGPEQRCRGRQHRRQQRAAPRHERKRHPIGQQHGGDRTEQRGHPIEPDPLPGVRDPAEFRQAHRRRLQPVDADRLLVAGLVAEPDGHEIRGLEHLLRGLGEARLVPIHRRQSGKPRKEHEKGDDREKRHGPDAGQHGIDAAYGCLRLQKPHLPSKPRCDRRRRRRSAPAETVSPARGRAV